MFLITWRINCCHCTIQRIVIIKNNNLIIPAKKRVEKGKLIGQLQESLTCPASPLNVKFYNPSPKEA